MVNLWNIYLQQKKSREESFNMVDDGYNNPYMSNMAMGGGGDSNKTAQPSIRLKTKEEKYAEDVLKLHEAYQVSKGLWWQKLDVINMIKNPIKIQF